MYFAYCNTKNIDRRTDTEHSVRDPQLLRKMSQAFLGRQKLKHY